MWKKRTFKWVLLSTTKSSDLRDFVKDQCVCFLCLMLALFLVPFSLKAQREIHTDAGTGFTFYVDNDGYAVITGGNCENKAQTLDNYVYYWPDGVSYGSIKHFVKAIAPEAFKNNKSLTNITINCGNPFVGGLIGGTIVIGREAFAGSSLKKIDFNFLSSVEIEERAFADTKSLSSVSSHVTVRKIGKEAFKGSCLKTISTYPGSNYYPILEIGESAFEDCVNLTNWDIDGDIVNSIGSRVLAGCKSLSGSLVFNSINSIPDGAFYGCTKLQRVHATGVTAIGESAFYGCSNLIRLNTGPNLLRDECQIEIPKSVTKIGRSAFAGCSKFTSVNWPKEVTKVEDGTFSGCSNLVTFTNWSSIKSVGSYAFNNCDRLKNIPPNATEFGAGAFSNCDSIISVKLPDTLKSIKSRTFRACANLSSVHLPVGLVSIEDYAFANCSKLASIEFPYNMQTIGKGAFESTPWKSIFVPNNVNIASGVNNMASHYWEGAFEGTEAELFIGMYPLTEEIGTSNLHTFIGGSTEGLEYDSQNIKKLSFLGWRGHFQRIESNESLAIHYNAPKDVLENAPIINWTNHSSKIIWCNIPDVRNTIKESNADATFFVESDTLHLDTSLHDNDRIVCVHPLGTTVSRTNSLRGQFYGDFKNIRAKQDVEDIDLLRYHLLCAPSIVVDSISANYKSYYENIKSKNESTSKREQLDKAFYALFPFKKFFNMSYSELATYYDALNSAFLRMFGKSLNTIYAEKDLELVKTKLQSVRESCDEITKDGTYIYIDGEKRRKFNDALTSTPTELEGLSIDEIKEAYWTLVTARDSIIQPINEYKEALQNSKVPLQSLYDESSKVSSIYSNIYPYIDTEKKNAFGQQLNEAQKALGGYDKEKVITVQSNLQTAYDTIIVVVNRYNEALSESKEQLQTLIANGNRLRKTDYADIYPYIDSNARNSLEAALAAADPESYDLQKVQSAKSQLQTAYDTIVAVINRYSAALSESKGQLQTLITNSSKLGKTAYADIYPYIDSNARNSLETALAAANPESFDLQNVQTSLAQLQTAYDQVMTLINTYSNNLTAAKQTLQQRLDEEGGLKDNSEFPFIDANLQKAYEDALKSAKTAINGYDVAAINSAIEPLHQAYTKASKAMASLIGELAPARSVLQTQINKCNDYLNDKPYYFTADYLAQLRSGAQRAEAAINTSDVNTIRQHITKLNTLFSEVDADIIANKNKVKQMQDSFARVFALMDTLKTIGLYDQAGERISPSGDLKEFSLFTFDGASIGYNKCLQTVKFAQGLAAYTGASNSGFYDEGVIDYTNKCTDFISRFETEFASLDAKYQLEKGKLQEAIQRLQSLKEDYPTAYANVDDNLKSRVEAKLTEWNVSGYAEVGRVYANADFSICDELQQAIGAYESFKENLSKMLANISKDCQTIANGANMNDVAVRSNYRVGDGLVTQEDQVSVIIGDKRTLIDGDGDTKVTLFSKAKTIDLDLNKECSNVVLAFANDESSLDHHFKVYATNNAQDNSSWKLQSEFVNTYSRKSLQKYVARQFVGLDDNYRYLRIEFVPTDECPKTTISELRVYHRANKFESEGADSCTQFFRLVAELQAQVDNQQELSLESYDKVSAAYARFNAFEDSKNFGLADFKETTAATYFNANKAVSLPHEVVGSIITGKNGRIVRDTRFDETHPVPANTAVVLEGVGGCSYYLMPTTDYVASVDGNLLQGMLTDGITQVLEGEAKYYQFSKGIFAWAKENGAPFSAKAGDVYLAIPNGMEQLGAYDFSSIYGIGDDVPPYTGINELQGLSKCKGIFDLNGRPIKVNDSRELMPGVYIVDGKKIVVK